MGHFTTKTVASRAFNVRVVTPEGGQVRTTWAEVMTDLARIEDQPTGTSSSWTDGVNLRERVIAFVHSSNSELLSTLAAMSRTGSDVAAVVFDGFMPGDEATHAVNTLTSVGISAIACHRGELSAAMRSMEQGAAATRRAGKTTATAVAEEPSTELAGTGTREHAA